MKKKNNKKNTRKTIKKENKLKQKILEINLSKATIITSIIIIIIIALITAGIIKTINESSREKVEVEEGEEYSPVNWIESTEVGEDGNYKKVPVPKGYVASQIEGETTVNGGFVIYEDNYNGKSINWDEIIIKDDSTENSSASGASVANVDNDGKEETNTNLESPKTPEVTSSEDETVDETAMTPENVSDEREQEKQGVTVEKNESQVNEENPRVDRGRQEEGTIPEGNSIIGDTSQEENGVEPQADGETEGGETTEIVEPEVSTAEQQTKKNIFELQKNVNQYVWVPVPDINRICGVDANGKLWGKLYSFRYSETTLLNWTETEGKIEITDKTRAYREPDVTHSLTHYDTDKNLKFYLYGETQYEMLAEEMEQNFYQTMKSIEQYGGYYIGRYETGDLSSSGASAVVRKMNTSIGSVTWYQMYKGCKGLAGRNGNVKTSMIWGSLWDETLKWLVESGAKTTGTDTIASQPITYWLISNSYRWGNYNTTSFNYISTVAEEPEATVTKSGSRGIPTGSAEYTKVNNIYDMAGNMSECTLEVGFSADRINRGGSYDSSDSTYSASYRNYRNPTSSYRNCGCRAILIIR